MGYLVTHRKRARITKAKVVRRRGMAGLGDLLLAATASTNPGAVAGTCSADGQFKLVNGAWQRLAVGEVCTTISPVNVNVRTPQPMVTDVACAAPPTGGPIVGGIALSPTEGDPVTYTWVCNDPNKPGLVRAQRAQVTKWLTDAQTRAFSDMNSGYMGTSGAAQVNANTIAGLLITGKWPLTVFTGPDGDGKQLLMTADANGYTFVWKHNPTAFQTLDNFLTSLSPISTEDLCKMIPIASKVPNPYAIAGSLVLQMSGKCPPTCPTGMLYDATSKQCSCPPGSVYNPTLQRCDPTTVTTLQKWLLPMAIFGGAALLIATLNRKTKATPP